MIPACVFENLLVMLLCCFVRHSFIFNKHQNDHQTEIFAISHRRLLSVTFSGKSFFNIQILMRFQQRLINLLTALHPIVPEFVLLISGNARAAKIMTCVTSQGQCALLK